MLPATGKPGGLYIHQDRAPLHTPYTIPKFRVEMVTHHFPDPFEELESVRMKDGDSSPSSPIGVRSHPQPRYGPGITSWETARRRTDGASDPRSGETVETS